jgi:ribosomal protein L37AE/L43A
VVKPGDWQTTCPACRKTIHRYRKPKTLSGYKCLCKARSTLVFEYKGDPALKPFVPMSMNENAKWFAICAGCQTEHFRVKRPKAGVWRCKCPQRYEITWRVRQR